MVRKELGVMSFGNEHPVPLRRLASSLAKSALIRVLETTGGYDQNTITRVEYTYLVPFLHMDHLESDLHSIVQFVRPILLS